MIGVTLWDNFWKWITAATQNRDDEQWITFFELKLDGEKDNNGYS